MARDQAVGPASRAVRDPARYLQIRPKTCYDSGL